MTQIRNAMQSRTFWLLQPGKLEERSIEREIKDGEVVIEPSMASVCHADIRYYAGLRKPEAMAKKLPMALLHEGIGTVIESRSQEVQVGERVVIVPNLPGHLVEAKTKEECCLTCGKGVADNYCENGHFMGSGYDGIAQSRVVVPAACAVPIPADMPDEIAVLSELCTVSYHALSHVHQKLLSPNTTVAIFGDGPVGYLTAAMVRYVYGIDELRLTVFGAMPEKLEQFKFAARHLVQNFDFSSSKVGADIIIECTGGKFSESAINQGIDLANRGGSLILMGVTEERVPINTRDILEKGLTLYGSSRSSVSDYHAVIKALENPAYQQALSLVLPDTLISVSKVEDFDEAMKSASAHRGWQKTILDFKW
ncbi:alcohol dehydrogenase catalytic domain-containing protein [Niallia sp. NCCP-28]|uniref:alcohol dehydrogenase catalytic domain-containing protein n=1 Tax=Niallia sp. NCCP-28 TaxID=2934712 RepID=UPI0020848273|nr:alcohol dehydrogenase catalytic domain-containing protein [Niallia sp. NCCP-28]GKU83902.1 ribitol-5-phosphate 2-dehydrogenase [Niallia sp. NCCP-28]